MTTGRHVVELPFEPASSRSGWQHRGRELDNRLRALSAAAAGLFPDFTPVAVSTGDWPAAEAAIGEMSTACLHRLRAGPPAGAETAAITGLLCDLQELALDVDEHALASRTRRVAACDTTLARLRTLRTTSDLIERAPRELAWACGFDRAMLSKVHGGRLIPWVVHFTNPDGGNRWMEDWLNTPIPLELICDLDDAAAAWAALDELETV
jgi:hypothetical protein